MVCRPYPSISVTSQCTAAVDGGIADFGRIDVLVNNVGYNVPSWAHGGNAGRVGTHHSGQLTGPFFCAQAMGRFMLAAGRGRIINVGTHTAVKANVRRTAYGAARAGMVQWTRNLGAGMGGARCHREYCCARIYQTVQPYGAPGDV